MFALGVVLYEILVGVNPFRKGNVLATMRATVNEPVVDARLRVGTIDDELSRLVASLMEKDPAKRLKNSGDVVRRLGKILHRSGAKWGNRQTSRPVMPEGERHRHEGHGLTTGG